MLIRRFLLSILLLAIPFSQSFATHIVGAELYYECIDPVNYTYEITLKMYRDCLTGQAPFDDPISLFVFDGGTANYQIVNVPKPPLTPEIIPEDWDACVGTPYNICVEEAIYKTTLTLPPQPGGYDLAWARCCRNASITNLASPLEEGVTFLAHVPDPGNGCNSMPTFDNTPPIFLCANQPFFFDYSATDIDGDSLVYTVTNPFTGVNFQNLGAGNPNFSANPPVVDITNPMGPQPYQNVQFAPGYTFWDPFGSGLFSLDQQTGFLNVTPNQAGIYVLAVSVFEYRNGVLLSENKRDFQIHVINCLPQGAPPSISHDFAGLNSSNDTIFVSADVPFCYDITVTDPNPTDQLDAYTVSSIFGNGSFFPPAATFTFSGTNPITGQVCWQPACVYDGQVIPMILGAYDINDCPNVGDVFDTVYVSVSASANISPQISLDFGALNVSNDTIIINASNSFCVDFEVNDPNIFDSLVAYPLTPIYNSADPPSFTINQGNPLTGQICWEPGCAYEGQVIDLSFGAGDFGVCNSSSQLNQNLYVQINVPPNQPPAITTDITALPSSNDTVFVFAEEDFCFPFTAADLDIGDSLTVFTPSPIFNGPNPPTFNYTGQNPISGQICWAPDCSYEGQVVEFIVVAKDPGVCNNIGEDADTIYVSVSVPPNDPPAITSDLTGLNTNGDTIIVNALDDFCYTFNASDINTGDSLQAFTVSPIFNGPDAPTFTFSGTNPVTGQICWEPGCDYVGQVIELQIGTEDDARCSSALDDFNTVYVQIELPPNNPPQATQDLTGLTVSNDTIFMLALDTACFTINLEDFDTGDSLTPVAISPIFNDPTGPSINFNGINPITADICWVPSCDYEGQTIEMIVGATDNGRCNNPLDVYDTVYISVIEPNTAPPLVYTDLTGTPHSNDTIYIWINDSLCYDFFIVDQTFESGIDYEYEFLNYQGNNLGLATVQTTYQNDTIFGTVCFTSNCSNGGSLYYSVVTGLDLKLCPPFAERKDTTYIRVFTDFESFAGPDASFCEGEGGVQINATPIGGTGPYYYFWDCISTTAYCGISDPFIPNPVVNPDSAALYFVQITDDFGCTSEVDSVLVTVDALPRVDAGPDIFLCEDGPGEQLQPQILNPIHAPGPYIYNWQPAAGLNNTTIFKPYARPDTTTIYTLQVTSANGCSSFATTLDTLSTVVVNVNERPILEAGPDMTGCKGDSAFLLGYAVNPDPNYDYYWTPSTGLADPNSPTTMASPPATTGYFLMAYNNGCPGVADSMVLTVQTLPTADPGVILDVCAGDSVQLSGIAGGDSLTDTYSFNWMPGLSLNDSTLAKPLAGPDTTTVYTLVATSEAGCESDPYGITVQVLPTVIADAGLDTLICRGDSIQLDGSYSFHNNFNPATYPVLLEWSPVDGLSEPLVEDPMISPDQSMIYTLSASYGVCTTSDEVKIEVFNAVDAGLESDTTVICGGDSVQLYALGGVGSAQYQWWPASAVSDSSIANPVASPDTQTTYYVTISEGNCKAIDSITIDVHPAVAADYFYSQPVGCDSLTVSFLANVSNAYAVSWDFGDGSPVSNEDNPAHTYIDAGTYPVTLTATGAGGCQDVVSLISVQVAEPVLADFTSVPIAAVEDVLTLPEANVSFQNASSNAASYYWSFGDGAVSNMLNPVHEYHAPGEYYVTLIAADSLGCRDSVVKGPFNVLAPDLFIPNVFTPNGDGFYDEFLAYYDGVEDFQMLVYDRWGKLMFEEPGNVANGWDGNAPSGAEASEGTYYYVITIGAKSYTGYVSLLR